jgi:hypothetical protein
MTHEDKGHYARKHQGKKIDDSISKKILTLAEDNNLTCAAAHRIAKDLDIQPSDIGIQIDLMEFRITKCQLGLFGYSPEPKKINPDIEISKNLAAALDKTIVDNKISCKLCWDIADSLKIKRLDLGSACEKKDFRIKPCQLGAF